MVIKIVNYETNVQVNQFHLHPALSKEILMLGLGTAGLVYTHSEPCCERIVTTIIAPSDQGMVSKRKMMLMGAAVPGL